MVKVTGLEIGKDYRDGWGVTSTVGGVVTMHPDWVWTIQGNWYRQSDGRKISYSPVDKTRPDGPRRHVPFEKASKWDLEVR